MAQLQREAEARNPELATLQAEVQRLQARLRETQASRFPGVELRYSQFREADQQQGLFGLGVRLPLLDQRRGAIDEAAAELARAQTQLDGRRQELALQIESAAAALKVAQLRVDALGRGALPDAEAVLRVAQAAYRFGERGILDVLDAQRLLRSVRSELIDARFRLQAAAVELEFLAGRYALPESMNQP
jgi:cobalt-zinc-cadmium efflux system outer membrane protein